MSSWDTATATLFAWVHDLPHEAEKQFRQLRAAPKEDLLRLAPYVLLGLLPIFFLQLVVGRLLRRPLPPGPKVRTIPPQEPWKLYHAWARNSGPLMTITSLSQQVILMTNLDTVLELFEKRSLIYCNRPRWPMADLLGRQDNVGFTQYGERLRKGRRFLHSALNERYLLDQDGWGNFLGAHSLALLRMMVEGDPREAVGKLVETMIVQFAYGRDFAAQYGELARQVQAQTNLALQPGRWAVNTMPILSYVPTWFPGAHFRRWAAEAKQLFWTLTRPPFERVKADMAAGTAQPSFVKHNLEEFPNMSKADERILIGATGSVYDAGVSTTVATLQSFLLFLSRHPVVQDKAHAELLRVLGGSSSTGVAHLPTLADRIDLPYIDAVVQEIFRYNPPVPLVSHAPRKEDTFAGYRIPKGTWVTANIWSMLHDEEMYPDPDTFNPERFLPKSGVPPRDPRTLIFGFGRRACPGLHLASQLTFLVVARTLALYTLVPASPADADAPIEFATGLVAAPKPFKVRLVPRSGATEEILAQAIAEAEATVPARPPA
ncbi:cytochrome P450 [Dentipellis sp. KUC8613]|nr:cytochrome P450 [Dentipellis sp. KUC8613]